MTTDSRSLFARVAAPALAASLLLALACQPDEPEAPVAQRVENPELGIALASLPAPFRVAVNQGDELSLEATGAEGTGALRFAVGPLETTINLVDLVKERRTIFQELPEGFYFGNRELGTPIGTAYTARGTFRAEEGLVEETWIYAIHPVEYRLLTLTYRYPAGGDSQTRVQELLSVLGEVEGAAAPPVANEEPVS